MDVDLLKDTRQPSVRVALAPGGSALRYALFQTIIRNHKKSYVCLISRCYPLTCGP